MFSSIGDGIDTITDFKTSGTSEDQFVLSASMFQNFSRRRCLRSDRFGLPAGGVQRRHHADPDRRRWRRGFVHDHGDADRQHQQRCAGRPRRSSSRTRSRSLGLPLRLSSTMTPAAQRCAAGPLPGRHLMQGRVRAAGVISQRLNFEEQRRRSNGVCSLDRRARITGPSNPQHWYVWGGPKRFREKCGSMIPNRTDWHEARMRMRATN